MEALVFHEPKNVGVEAVENAPIKNPRLYNTQIGSANNGRRILINQLIIPFFKTKIRDAHILMCLRSNGQPQ
jgi:hypothetical protein